jgi:hypothetical protein
MPLILLKPFVFTRISAQTQCTIRKSASDPSSNYSSFCRTAHARCGMRITIQAPADGGTELETDRELHRAFMILHNVFIRTRGGGRFADTSTAIILARETDALEALAALKQAGIRALAS